MAALEPSLEDVLGHTFTDPDLLGLALTHRGSLEAAVKGRQAGRQSTNERLEFLGDRVLGLVVAEGLLRVYPNENEGALATRLAALVSASTLARVAEDVGLAPHIKMAPGQQADASESAILADACEAVIGALYLDGGLEAASRFITHRWEPLMRAEIVPPKDPKTALQEWAQGRRLELPAYEVVSESGPAHAPEFTVSVTVEGFPEQIGKGRTKRHAEQAAATALLDILPRTSQ
tara:strand:+ start:954 stop:1655 length:702 start_codon:yes stop_codon:yes gene_type:complete